MRKSKEMNPGEELETRLLFALGELDAAPLLGARDLPLLTGVSSKGFTDSPENVWVRLREILSNTNRVFRFGNRIVFESRMPEEEPCLITLVEGVDVRGGAEAHLANVFLCTAGDQDFLPSRNLVSHALLAEPVRGSLPLIRVYSRRPVYDTDFILRGPGWHPSQGILVHGPEVDPTPWPTVPDGTPVLERLPLHLRTLMGGFAFRSDVDRVNAISMFLTGLLVDRYVETGKPVALIDANQPGVGKTLLARMIGIILDGVEPGLVDYTSNEDELQKRIGAEIRTKAGSLIVLDNAKTMLSGALNSPTLEVKTTSPRVEFRILGESTIFTRDNDILWAVTMNDTCASRDLVSRGMPVRLAHEGDPGQRTFDGPEPIEYARNHRVEILCELAGMVERWTQAGWQPGVRRHRFLKWAMEIGGILEACGLREFLDNLDEAATEFTAGSDDIAFLAEHCVKNRVHLDLKNARPAADRVHTFETIGIQGEELRHAKSPRAKSSRVGKTLGQFIGREVSVDHKGRAGTAVLRSQSGRARSMAYYFEASWPDQALGVEGSHQDQQSEITKHVTVVEESHDIASPQTGAQGNDEKW